MPLLVAQQSKSGARCLNKATFDAEPWFVQASDEEIIKLAQVSWRGDYEADEVALFVEDDQPEVAEVEETGQNYSRR